MWRYDSRLTFLIFFFEQTLKIKNTFSIFAFASVFATSSFWNIFSISVFTTILTRSNIKFASKDKRKNASF